MKRAVSLLLTVCMVTTMTAPAFAATQEIAAEPIVGQTEEALTQPQEEELPAELPEEETLSVEEPAEEQKVELLAEDQAAPQEGEKEVAYEYVQLKGGISEMTADSEKTPPSGNDGPASYAFDGNMSSMWHTNYGGQTTPFPHYIQWCVGEAKQIGKIEYFRRQDSNVNGRWKNVTVYGKNGANSDWTELKANVEIPKDDASFVISFEPKTVTHLKVVINHAHDGDQFATAAEIKTYQAVEAQANGVSKQALRDLYASASEMNTANYMPESVQKLTDALNAAKAVLEQTDATAEAVKNAEKQLDNAINGLQVDKNQLAPGAPESQTTQKQPFTAGVAGSNNFRIPSIVTLKHGAHKGRLVAAIDARWNHTGDACALDTILSVSDDNGETWKYSFPNFFNDSTNAYHGNATAFIDPIMVEAENGDLYMMVDLFPGGVALNTAPRKPHTVSGYCDIDGAKRMVLYTEVGTVQTDDNYAYYVSDFGEPVNGKRFAPVLDKTDKSTAYYVDDHYYLYNAEKQPMYCRQLGSDKFVHQNVFFFNAKLHVRDAAYLWVVKSTDGGDNWSAPMIMNPQVRKQTNADKFYGVGPGAGLSFVDANGTNVVLLQAYTHSTEKSSFIYSADNGATWHRSPEATTGGHWSSESALVQIDTTTVRQFYRDDYTALNYTDYTWNAETQKFTCAGDPVAVPGASKTSRNQLSAIRYSQLVNGKPVFMLSTANGGGTARTKGHIYTLSLEADKTMKVINTYKVPETDAKYGYSSLTETADGNIALLYEGTLRTPANNSLYEDIYFKIFSKENVLPAGAELGGRRTIEVPLYGTVEDAALPVLTAEQLAALNAKGVVKAQIQDGKVLYTGLKTGTATVQLDENAVLTLNVVKRYKEENVTLNKQQSQSFTVNGPIAYESDSAVVKAEETAITQNSVYGNTGTNSSYNGNQELLSSALHTIKKAGDKYEIFAEDANGAKVWLNPDGNPGYPMANNAVAIALEQQPDGVFAIKGATRYLYFHRGNDNRFDRNSSYATQCAFMLYRPAQEGDTASTEIPGYVRVNQLTELKDNGKYLVAAKAENGTYFVLRPSLDGGNRYAHALKVDPQPKPETIGYTLTLTGLKAGKAVVVAGDTAYLVTVPAEKFTVTYTDGVEDEQIFADQTQQVEEGKATPAFNGEPKREGYVFAGWTPAVAETVTADVVYTATWKPEEVKPEPEKPEPTPEVKPEPEKPEPTPEVKPEPTPEVKPEPKPEPTPEAKPEVKPEPKPEPKPENKPAEGNTPAPAQKPSYGAATGDTTNMTLWVVLLIVSGALGSGVYFLNKKDLNEEKH